MTRRLLVAAVLAGVCGVLVISLQTSKPGWWERFWYPLKYEQIVRGHARNYHLDPDLLAAVIYQESKFRAAARSASGAVGLMQLLPSTAEGIANALTCVPNCEIVWPVHSLTNSALRHSPPKLMPFTRAEA